MILQNGFIALEPETGNVRAWVGGDNYKYFQYDHVNINTKRQIGSDLQALHLYCRYQRKGLLALL
jgi:penicillin-binding protein 1A